MRVLKESCESNERETAYGAVSEIFVAFWEF